MTKSAVRVEAEAERVDDALPQNAYEGLTQQGRRDTRVMTIIRCDEFFDGKWGPANFPKTKSDRVVHDGDNLPVYAFVRALKLDTRMEIDGKYRIRECQISVKRDDVENVVKGNQIRKEDQEKAEKEFVSNLNRVFSHDRNPGDFVLEAQYVEKTDWGWTKTQTGMQEHKDLTSALISGMRFLDRANGRNQWFYFVKITRREPAQDLFAQFRAE